MTSQAITQLLVSLKGGDQAAASELMPLVYDELRRIAASYMRSERPDHTLQATALVHEAYLHMLDRKDMNWQNRAHFFGAAAQLMRWILLDHARRHGAEKRGGRREKLQLEEALVFSPERSSELLALEDALRRLEELDARQGRIVELRYYGGLSIEETAEVLGISAATVKREWTMAKTWLKHEVRSDARA